MKHHEKLKSIALRLTDTDWTLNADRDCLLHPSGARVTLSTNSFGRLVFRVSEPGETLSITVAPHRHPEKIAKDFMRRLSGPAIDLHNKSQQPDPSPLDARDSMLRRLALINGLEIFTPHKRIDSPTLTLDLPLGMKGAVTANAGDSIEISLSGLTERTAKLLLLTLLV